MFYPDGNPIERLTETYLRMKQEEASRLAGITQPRQNLQERTGDFNSLEDFKDYVRQGYEGEYSLKGIRTQVLSVIRGILKGTDPNRFDYLFHIFAVTLGIEMKDHPGGLEEAFSYLERGRKSGKAQLSLYGRGRQPFTRDSAEFFITDAVKEIKKDGGSKWVFSNNGALGKLLGQWSFYVEQGLLESRNPGNRKSLTESREWEDFDSQTMKMWVNDGYEGGLASKIATSGVYGSYKMARKGELRDDDIGYICQSYCTLMGHLIDITDHSTKSIFGWMDISRKATLEGLRFNANLGIGFDIERRLIEDILEFKKSGGAKRAQRSIGDFANMLGKWGAYVDFDKFG